ncbi:MAG TPA: transglycosylase SLT domain-containing protein [Thermoanaerobaculia bacterium]|nr:transglycosylase SLT domain-containing protein [Thermoanaerobaculia bacterium]
MFGTLTLALAITVADPRPELVELQLAGKPQEALGKVEQELAERPQSAHSRGLDYLHGDLLDRLGRSGEAIQAFARTMALDPTLAFYSRYRMALDQVRVNHPEVAAGLISKVVAGDPGSPLMPAAVHLFASVLAQGGECRLLGGVRQEAALPKPQRREIQLSRAECALRTGYREMARSLLVSLLEESHDDDFARVAAEILSRLVADAEHGRLPLLLGKTFHQNKEYDRALQNLQRAGDRQSLSAREVFEAQALIGQALLSEQRYADASVAFSRLAALARTPGEKARALYQEGRAHELRGAWPAAAATYRQAWQTDSQGREWAAPALLGALRLEWRNGSEPSALDLYRQLVSRPEWRGQAVRAALFLAASDLSRGRRDRARAWLDQAAAGNGDDQLEAAYWDGRLAELDHDLAEAVDRYLEVIRTDPYHPLARAAQGRLAIEPLASAADAEGRRLAASGRFADVYGAWLLLGADDPAGRAAQHRLEQMLLADRAAAPYLRLAEVPVRRWPLWSHPLTRPEEMLLAMGLWREGAPAVRQHFPLSDPNLAYTGCRLLARGGEYARSISLAEALRERTPRKVPLALQPRDYRRLLYPFLYQDAILAQGKIRGVDPHLLTALIREESRFDSSALSPAARRGLAQLSPATARQLSAQLKLAERVSPEDLSAPGLSIALGAAQLSTLLKIFGNVPVAALAAHQAGESQAQVWKTWCFTQEPDEYFTKIGIPETRDFVRRVMASAGQYAELY